ncbi:MAG: DUF1273 family protein [Clostridia bacterium]|nr:DUF1273 family protein [Clostridia bacterium]
MNMPLFTKEKTCFFAGHRPYRFSFPPDQERAFYENLILNIRSAVRSLVLNGCDTFLCGGSIGFDILCAEEVILLKREFPFVKLVCVLPFEKHYEDFQPAWRNKFLNILAYADYVEYASREYVDGCYHERKQKMLDNSSHMLTYFDGRGGGTARILAAAQLKKLKIINLYNAPSKPPNITFFIGYDHDPFQDANN